MARKKSTTKSAKKKAATKKVRKRTVKKKAVKPTAKPSSTRKRSSTSKRSPAPKRKKKAKRVKSLGRPLLPTDAKLEIVFQKDHQARQIFEFLRIATIRELEQYSPDEIIEKITGPMIQTVGRIRTALALSNRCLAGDLEFAVDFQTRWQPGK